jgi:tRNA pseudouridine38-40 synthase
VRTRIALGVQYHGRGWHGWQSQPDGCTVQDALERALSQFAAGPVRVHCAGRTDAGVHALGQVVHFDTDAVRKPRGWVHGTNALLPESISATWCRFLAEPGEDFHARFSAIARTYHYVLFVDPVRSPHLAGRAGWYYHPLDLDAMDAAARGLIGTHDFSAFRGSECQAKSPVKTLHGLDVLRSGAFVVFTLRADAFLQHMVRNLVGSLIAVGQRKFPPSWVREVLDGRDRARAAPTFMPDGLYLAKVEYPERFEIPEPPPLSAVFPGLVK